MSYLAPLGFTWSPLVSPLVSHLNLVLLELVGSHMVSLGLVWAHLVSLGGTWIHLDLLTWSHLESLGLTGHCFEFTTKPFLSMEQRSLPARNEGMPPKSKGKRESLCVVFQMQSHLTTRARNHGTKRNDFQVGLVPPTSDVGGPRAHRGRPGTIWALQVLVTNVFPKFFCGPWIKKDFKKIKTFLSGL
jgi:hypothetical protein